MLLAGPLYPAGEKPIEGVDSEWLYRGIKEHGHKEVVLCESQDRILEVLLQVAKPGDVVMTLGAGNIHRIGEAFLESA